jgi:WD40 repeat protein
VGDSHGKQLREFPPTGYPASFASLAFSPDGKLLAAGNQQQAVQLWDVTTGKSVRVFPNQGKPYTPRRVLFSADGQTLIAADIGGTIRAWSVETGAERQLVESNGSFNIFCLDVSADGRNLAGQDADGNVYVWELATGKQRARFPNKEQVWSLAFSPDGQHLIGALHSNPCACGTSPRAKKPASCPGRRA